MNNHGSDFKQGDIIDYCDELYEVVHNNGWSGTVREYFGEGKYGETISNFKWDIYGEKCKLVKSA